VIRTISERPRLAEEGLTIDRDENSGKIVVRTRAAARIVARKEMAKCMRKNLKTTTK